MVPDFIVNAKQKSNKKQKRMQKENKIFLSILIMIIGFVLNGLAWTISMGPTLNTLSLLLGLGSNVWRIYLSNIKY